MTQEATQEPLSVTPAQARAILESAPSAPTTHSALMEAAQGRSKEVEDNRFPPYGGRTKDGEVPPPRIKPVGSSENSIVHKKHVTGEPVVPQPSPQPAPVVAQPAPVAQPTPQLVAIPQPAVTPQPIPTPQVHSTAPTQADPFQPQPVAAPLPAAPAPQPRPRAHIPQPQPAPIPVAPAQPAYQAPVLQQAPVQPQQQPVIHQAPEPHQHPVIHQAPAAPTPPVEKVSWLILRSTGSSIQTRRPVNSKRLTSLLSLRILQENLRQPRLLRTELPRR
jgi:hypothetical protein